MSQSLTRDRLVSHAILIFLCLLAVLPMLGLTLAAFNGSGGLVSGISWPSVWTFDNFTRAWGKGHFDLGLRNSAAIALLTVTMCRPP